MDQKQWKKLLHENTIVSEAAGDPKWKKIDNGNLLKKYIDAVFGDPMHQTVWHTIEKYADQFEKIVPGTPRKEIEARLRAYKDNFHSAADIGREWLIKSKGDYNTMKKTLPSYLGKLKSISNNGIKITPQQISLVKDVIPSYLDQSVIDQYAKEEGPGWYKDLDRFVF